MGKLIHRKTAGRVERRLLLLLKLLLLLFEASRRNWTVSKTIVEAFGFRLKLVAGLEEAFVSSAVRRLLFLVGKRKVCCVVGELSIEHAVRVLMELFRCIHVVVRRSNAVGVVIVVVHVARTLELVQIHQLSHQTHVFVV